MNKRRKFRSPDSKTVALSPEDRSALDRLASNPSNGITDTNPYLWRDIVDFPRAMQAITSGVDIWAVPLNAEGFPHDHELGRFVHGAIYAGPLGQGPDLKQPVLSYVMAGSEWLSPTEGGNLLGYVVTHFRLIDNRPPQKTA